MPQQILANSAAIASGHPCGTAAGTDILRDGGNAIDAAVGAMIALSVAIPGSVGLGGYGGSAVIYKSAPTADNVPNKESGVFAVDFDSCAPLAFRDGLVTSDPQSNYYGAKSVTVPAVVAGLDAILRQFGTKNWKHVSQPAIRLAEDGVEFDAEHVRHFNRCEPHFDRDSLHSLFQGDSLPTLGALWRQPELARLLHQLSDEGPASFYEGASPRQIVQYLRERGGILDESDFEAYKPQMVEAVALKFRDCELFTPPPPSGGITSLAIVQTMEKLNLAAMEPWRAHYFHYLGEATKLCWHERYSRLGDPDFIDVPIDELIAEESAQERANKVQTGNIYRKTSCADNATHTANVIAADGDGNLISLTATQGWMYGSHLVVDGLGLVLNHGMSRFDYSPGHPNSPAPGKRMQHNMAPVIALHDGRPAFAFGLPGGPKIVSVTAQLALSTIGFGATPSESITAPRLHTDGDEPLQLSNDTAPTVVAELERMGHSVRLEADMGGPVNVLAVDPETNVLDIASGETTGAVAGI